MKHHDSLIASNTFTLILALLCPLLWGLPAWAQDSRTIVLSTFPSHGMGVLNERILTEAYASFGYNTEIVHMPAERALTMSSQGIVDGEAGRVAVIEKDNPSLIRIPTPLYHTRVVAFTKGLNIDLTKGFEALRPFKLASVRGYKFIESKTADMNRYLSCDYNNLFELLDAGRIDVAVSEYLEAYANVGGKFPPGVKPLYPPLASKPMYHYLHEKNAALVPLISKALKDMNDSGRILEIFNTLTRTYSQGEYDTAIPTFFAPCGGDCGMHDTKETPSAGEAVQPALSTH